MSRLAQKGSGVGWYDVIPDAALKYISDHLDPSVLATPENTFMYKVAQAISFCYLGITFGGMIPHRPQDRFGAAVIYARFSDNFRAFDQDTLLLTGVGPIRDYETNLELTYVAQIVPGWTVQPNLQFIWHPSGDASKNATVVGARSLWRY